MPAPYPTLHHSALMTQEQIAANRMLLRLTGDSAVRAAQADLVARIGASTAADTVDAKARLSHAVAGWTHTLILREIAADPVNPSVQWLCDDTTMHFEGTEIPYRSSCLMSPDRIYRGVFFDGAGQYEITGQVDLARRPAEFSFELTPGEPGRIFMQTANASTADLGDQLTILTDKNIQMEADGKFRITLNGEPGPNHLRAHSGPMTITLRDLLSDWGQRPNRLAIRRVDATDARPLDEAAVQERLLRDLPGWVQFFADYKDSWFGGLEYNKLRGPVSRDGGWGFLAAGRYRLEAGEALVVTTTNKGAAYTGFQLTDPWLVAPDSIQHQASLNNNQVVPNSNGSVSYVIAAEDPGVANWLDTGGLHDGFAILRWEVMPQASTAEGMVRDVTLTKLADIAKDGLPGAKLISAAERATALARRGQAYLNRLV